jgi:polar amino acid transport system substrate-binding protein
MALRSRILAVLAVCSLALGAGTANASRVVQHQAQAGNPLHLINAGWLTVGSDTTYPPMEAADPNHPGQFVGADVDLAQALAKAMGLKGAHIVNNTYDTIIPALQRHRFDVIMSSMNDTPARAKVIAFVDYMRASEGILVKTSSSIHANSYSGMCGHTVAVESGTTELDGLNAANKTCKSKIDIKQFAKDTDAYNAFASGHAEAYTGDLPVVALYVKNGHGQLRMAGKPFGAGENYGIGLLKGNSALKTALKHALTKIRASGQYARILKHWGVGGAGF